VRRLSFAIVLALVACQGAGAAKPPTPQPRFAVPFGIATIGRAVFITDWRVGRMLRFDRRTRRLTVVARGLGEPTDLVANGSELYAADFRGQRVLRLTPAGAVSKVADVPLATAVAVHGRSLYVSSLANYVFRVDLDTGSREVVAGDGSEVEDGDGGPARAARVVGAHGISVDAEGDVYLQGRRGLRRIDAQTGTIDTVSSQTVGRTVNAPDGTIYFADGDPRRGVVGAIRGAAVEILWRSSRPPTDLELQPDGTLLFGLGEPRASVLRLDPRTRHLTMVVRSR
jgi:hypothetical protein